MLITRKDLETMNSIKKEVEKMENGASTLYVYKMSDMDIKIHRYKYDANKIADEGISAKELFDFQQQANDMYDRLCILFEKRKTLYVNINKLVNSFTKKYIIQTYVPGKNLAQLHDMNIELNDISGQINNYWLFCMKDSFKLADCYSKITHILVDLIPILQMSAFGEFPDIYSRSLMSTLCRVLCEMKCNCKSLIYHLDQIKEDMDKSV